MTGVAKEVLMDIATCGLECGGESHVCHGMWQEQGCPERRGFQLSEPWVGDIENAPLLFISINPHFEREEVYPCLKEERWLDQNNDLSVEALENFFEGRFAPENGFVRYEQGHYWVRMNSATRPWKKVGKSQYWPRAESVADIVLGREARPGEDFAMTELVHCKTRKSKRITCACLERCSSLWLDKILGLAKSLEKIVVVGQFKGPLGRAISDRCNIENCEKYNWYPSKVNGRDIQVMFIDHFASHPPHTVDFERIRLACSTR